MAMMKILCCIILSFFHRLFDIILHKAFRIAYFGKKVVVPDIQDHLLLSSATSLAAKIRKKELKSEELLKAYTTRVLEVKPIINAVLGCRFEEALKEAKAIDKLIASNFKTEDEMERETPFLGIPFSMKDLLAVEGIPLTRGFELMTEHLMKEAGAILLVTTNMSEFGMYNVAYDSDYGRISNPYDTSRTCGGSSGGEGSLIGSAGSVIGISSDIEGSLRRSAFFCGVFGHKPTSCLDVSGYGSYSPSGDIELVPFFCMGPLCRYATDLNSMMKVLAGKNASLLHLDIPVKMNELKIFYIEDVGNHAIFTKVESDMVNGIHKVLHHFQNAYKIVPQKLNLPILKHMYFIWSTRIANCKVPTISDDEPAERKSHMFFSLELMLWFVKQIWSTFPAITLGLVEKTVLNKTDYFTMLQDLQRELEEVLGDNGILLFPAYPTVAPHHNEPLFNPLNFAYTGIFNVLAFPVTQCPLGLGSEKLPIGVQVVATPYNDRTTLAVAVELEKVFGGWLMPSPVIK